MEPDNAILLARAAFEGDEAAVRRLVSGGTDINARGAHWTALHAAIESGSRTMVELLLKLGANPNHSGGTGPPLNHVIDLEIDTTAQRNLPDIRDTGILEVLLASGADPHLPDEDGETALTFAARTNHFRALALLRGET